MKKSKIEKLVGSDDPETRRHFRDNFEVGIEFERRKFKVIAPPLNHRINYKAAHLKREAKMLSRR